MTALWKLFILNAVLLRIKRRSSLSFLCGWNPLAPLPNDLPKGFDSGGFKEHFCHRTFLHVTPMNFGIPDFSLVVPLSTGVIAAIIFFIFEIIVFPLTFSATSKAAAFSLQRRTKKGQSIKVRSINFPVWTEGLLDGQKTHWGLLIVRIVFIAIPVYLETRLQTVEQPVFETIVLPHTYEVNPVKDSVIYGDTTNESLLNLQNNAELVANACTHYDADGWLIATVGNVTYQENRENVERVICMNGTEKRLYRPISKLPHYVQSHPNHERIAMPPSIPGNFTISASISYGSAAAFQGSVDDFQGSVDAVQGSEELPNPPELPHINRFFRVENLSILNNPKITCHATKNYCTNGIQCPLCRHYV